MKVIILNDFAYVNGGASQVAVSSAIGLANHGVDVRFFAAVGPEDSMLRASLGSKLICLDQHEILCDPNRFRAGQNGLWNRSVQRELHRALNGFDSRETVVHLHGWTKALSSAVVAELIRRGFSLVISMHDYFLSCPNGAFYNYPKNHICRLQSLSLPCLLSNCDSRSYLQKMWRFGRSLIQIGPGGLPRGVHHFIAVSEFSQKILRPYLPQAAQIYRVNNPIAVHKRVPAPVETNSLLLFVGRLSIEKGVLLLANSMQNIDFPIRWVGDGALRAEVFARNPDSQITGWLPHTKVLEHLLQSRGIIFPSLLYETQGLIVLEAAALGIPAIVPDTSAAREMVEDGVTGLWFHGGNMDDLCTKIHLLQEGKFASKLGMEAYHRYWSDPKDLDTHVHQLIGVYQKILGG